MSRRDSFDEECRAHRSKDGPGRARGRGWYWGGYWGAPGNTTGYLGEQYQPPNDLDHLGAQFTDVAGQAGAVDTGSGDSGTGDPGSTQGGVAAAGGDGGSV